MKVESVSQTIEIGSRGAVEIVADAVRNDRRSTWEKIARELPDCVKRWKEVRR